MTAISSRIARDTEVANEVSTAIVDTLLENEVRVKAGAGSRKQVIQAPRVGSKSGSRTQQKAVAAKAAQKRRIKAIVKRSISDTHDVVFSSKVDPATVQLFAFLKDLVPKKRGELSERKLEMLVEAMLPDNDPMGRVHSQIELDNAEARVRFVREVPCLTAIDLADMAGHNARNRSVTASRWKSEGKAFSVSAGRQELYPAFQFRDGKPDPVIAKTLAALPEKLTAWQVAFWFVSSNRWLDGEAPRDRLNDPEAVIDAAHHLSEVPAG